MPSTAVTIERSWRHIRTRLEGTRRRLGISRVDVAAKCGCARSTIEGIDGGDRYSRIDAVLGYVHALDDDLDLVVAGRHVVRLARLDEGEVVLLRAAAAAAQAQRLNPLESAKVRDILDRLAPQAP